MGKKLEFSVNVEDTTAPDVKLQNNGNFQIITGETLPGKDIVAEMDDLSGISNVTFSDAVTVDEEEKICYLLLQLVMIQMERTIIR